MAAAGDLTEVGPEQARRQFGAELRALRKRAGLTGGQLADRLGWSQAKVSKTETGKTMPTVADVRAFAEGTGAGGPEAAALVQRFTELTTRVTGWRTLLRSGIVGSQQLVNERDLSTAVLRQVGTVFISGLLQTAEYARAVLGTGPDPTVDVAAGVAARLRRQEVLYAPGKEFRFVLMEAALRLPTCGPAAMAVQLDRISQLSTLDNVNIGILPETRRLPVVPLHGFRIHDDELASVELETGAVQIHDPADVAHYRRLFDMLDEVAEHGADLRHRLHQLAEHHARRT